MNRLAMDQSTLQNARSNLVENSMIAWQEPLYQVLSLDVGDTVKRSHMEQSLSLGNILKNAMEQAV